MEMVVEFVNLVMKLSGFLGQLYRQLPVPWNNVMHRENRKIYWNKDKRQKHFFQFAEKNQFY